MSRAAGDELSPRADRGADTAAGRAPDRLSDRLDRLPPGHPSSPYEADGTPREPAPRLRDYDTFADDDVADLDLAPSDARLEARPDVSRPDDTFSRYTDSEWAEHRADARVRLDDANRKGLATEVQFGIGEDGEAWVASRRAAHGVIIDDLYAGASNVPCEHQAIVAGGIAGAGKTTVLADHAGIDRSQYLTINPDDIKAELAKRDLVPLVEGLSPMEASDLVHEESSHIAKQLAIRAQGDGKNIIWDITMSSSASAEKRIDDLRHAGYTSVTGIFVDIPVSVSLARAEARHRYDEDRYRAGEGLGGRYVPEEYIKGQADEDWGSKNRRTFEGLKSRFDDWTIFDNGVDDRDPIRVQTISLDTSEETRS
jgi:predicted ABC-type ATPase